MTQTTQHDRHKNISMVCYDEIVTSLDSAAKKFREEGNAFPDVDTKVLYYRKEKAIQAARDQLISLYFTFEDYSETGELEIPTLAKPVKY